MPPEAPTTNAADTQATQSAAPTTQPAAAPTSRAARLQAMRERLGEGNDDADDSETGDDDAEAPAGTGKGVPSPADPAATPVEPAPSPPVSAPPTETDKQRAERIARIEALQKTERATMQRELELKQREAKLAERESAIARAEELTKQTSDVNWLLRRLAVEAKRQGVDHDKIAEQWLAASDPSLLAQSLIDERAGAAESKALAEIEALRAEIRKRDEEAQRAAQATQVRQQFGDFVAKADAPLARAFLAQNPATFWDAADRIAEQQDSPSFESVLSSLEYALRTVGGVAAPQPAAPVSQSPAPVASPNPPAARQASQGQTLTNGSASETASLGEPKMSHRERVRRLSARFK